MKRQDESEGGPRVGRRGRPTACDPTRGADCLFPTCTSEAIARGLCSNHRNRASKLVASGRTTWAELERLGRSLPPQPRTSNVDAWFLTGRDPDAAPPTDVGTWFPGRDDSSAQPSGDA